jgi:hypothetical protein
MKKVILHAAAILMLVACDNMKKENSEADNSEWPTKTDTIIYPSVKDPRKMDTLLLKSGVDTTMVGRVDTIMMPSPEPPYNYVMSVRKVVVRRVGEKIKIQNQY